MTPTDVTSLVTTVESPLQSQSEFASPRRIQLVSIATNGVPFIPTSEPPLRQNHAQPQE